MLWRVPTAKDQVNSSPNFSPNKLIFSPKVLSLVNVLASSNRKGQNIFLAKVPRQRGQLKRIFRRVHFPVCRLGSSLNFSLKLVKLSEKMTRKIIKINQEKVLSGFQPQRTKPVFAQLLAKPYF